MKGNEYNVLINENVYGIDTNDLASLDLIDNKDGSFHCLVDNKKFEIKIMKFEFQRKKMTLKINGNSYVVIIKDQFDMLIDKMGLISADIIDIKEVHAPMPGLVLALQVKAGDNVSKGDTLLVLEAMKMENMIKSPIDGTIKKLNVKSGDAVDKGQLLIEFE